MFLVGFLPSFMSFAPQKLIRWHRAHLVTVALVLSGAPASSQIVVDNFNQGTTTGAVVANTSWVNQVTQGTSSITVGGTATSVQGWASSSLSINATGMTYVRITAQRTATNTNQSVVVQLLDQNSEATTFSVPASSFLTGSSTTVQIPISAWGSGFDRTSIVEYNIGGGGVGASVVFHMTLENLELGAGLLALSGGTMITAGDQVYATAQTLTGNTTLGNTNGSNNSGKAITFNSTINGAYGLTLNTSGTTTLGGAVGDTTALASFSTDAGGTTAINGGLVRTSGNQSFGDPISLGADATLRTLVDGAINILETVTGNNHSLLIDEVAGAGTFKSASGLSSFTKSGAGKITLTGASTFTGSTIVTGGTLALGLSNALSSSSPLVLGGGTFALAGYQQTMATLTVSAGSTIDFGTTTASLSFGASSGLTWSGTLTITNYSSASNTLRFGDDSSALTNSQLSSIRFADYGNAPGLISASGYVTPSAIPEPSTYAAILGLAALGTAWIKRRRTSARGAADPR